jgi:3-dehydroquinate dehydratase-2
MAPEQHPLGRSGFWNTVRMTRSVLVLNGPNLNLLGRRAPEVYGVTTLADVEAMCRAEAEGLRLEPTFFQSNHEGALIDRIHDAFDTGSSVVANLGAYTHTSVALRDALEVVTAPVVEVHISNIHRREPFREHSYISTVADAVIVGAGVHGYALALRHVAHLLS